MRVRSLSALVALAILGAVSTPASVLAQTNAPPPTSNLSPEDALRTPEATVSAMSADVYGKWLASISTAAKQGNAEAQFRLGVEFGRGKYYQDMVDWLTKAATQGHVTAQTLLGTMYLSGEQIPKDYAKALMWLTKGAAQGNVEAEAELGYVYERGYGVQPNMEVAIELFKKAAAQGDSDSQKELRKIASERAKKRAAIPAALVFECQLDTLNHSSETRLLSGSDAEAVDFHKRYEACLRSNWHRLFGEAPFPGD